MFRRHAGHGHGFRGQVGSRYLVPDATQSDDTQVSDDLSTLYRPRHARAFEALGAYNFTGSFGDAAADRKSLAAIVLIAHPMPALLHVGRGLIVTLGCA